MTENITNLTETLAQNGIRPSYHRVRILEYLYQCHTHPTVDEIFNQLSPEIPTLSKATIYNTMHAFVGVGLVREVTIDVDAHHYDVMVEPHGHFKCLDCGEIFNFGIHLDSLAIEGLQDFQINQKDIYFSGLCPTCKSKTNSE